MQISNWVSLHTRQVARPIVEAARKRRNFELTLTANGGGAVLRVSANSLKAGVFRFLCKCQL
jgi:hypothetical protein